MEEVKKWLNKVGLENYIEHFVEHAIDEVVIDELNEDDLREIGLTLGARKRFLKALPFNRIDPSLAEESTSEAERRQVTVVFCDLVDSTPLAERLDPEELRSLIESFQEICVRVVTKHKGYIARYLGDGILIYFGYPRAQEGDAVRAVYAALEIVETISRRTDLDLQVHIGIHTGLVVAGDTREEKAAIFGDTPNIAARIEGIAGPDEVFLSPTTKNLVDSYIVTDIMGSYELKGLSKPMVLYKATELKTAHANS
ncbi:MAG: class 3 adenylate cyclase, partial [Gammaproteobacteria bacterium]